MMISFVHNNQILLPITSWASQVPEGKPLESSKLFPTCSAFILKLNCPVFLIDCKFTTHTHTRPRARTHTHSYDINLQKCKEAISQNVTFQTGSRQHIPVLVQDGCLQWWCWLTSAASDSATAMIRHCVSSVYYHYKSDIFFPLADTHSGQASVCRIVAVKKLRSPKSTDVTQHLWVYIKKMEGQARMHVRATVLNGAIQV